MIQDYTVNTEFVNKQTGERTERVYPLTAYCGNIAFELKQVLFDVENIFCQLEGYKDRSQWSQESETVFLKIRKKLLNGINGVGRLPESLHYKNESCSATSASEFIAHIIDHK